MGALGMATFGSLVRSFERRAFKRTFPLWESLGFQITPCDFEDPVPNLSELDEGLWSVEDPLLGLEMNEERQIAFLRKICARYKPEYDRFGLHEPNGDCPYFSLNGRFGEVDGDVLHGMIRHARPRRVIEIGSGWSTIVTSHALALNGTEHGLPGELIAIEPEPAAYLARWDARRVSVLAKKVQEVELALFESLEANDVLFIDSSHVVRIGSDVNHEVFQILPRLKQGVLIHFHDIFFPTDYPRRWVKDLRIFYNEMYLIRALLMFNTSYEVVWAGNWMKSKHPELVNRLFRTTASQSLWLRKTI